MGNEAYNYEMNVYAVDIIDLIPLHIFRKFVNDNVLVLKTNRYGEASKKWQHSQETLQSTYLERDRPRRNYKIFRNNIVYGHCKIPKNFRLLEWLTSVSKFISSKNNE